jgi:hypothetical protein
MTNYFTLTSDEHYDRHHYILHFTNGKSIKFEEYELAKNKWMSYDQKYLDYIEVIDPSKKNKRKSKGGFG